MVIKEEQFLFFDFYLAKIIHFQALSYLLRPVEKIPPPHFRVNDQSMKYLEWVSYWVTFVTTRQSPIEIQSIHISAPCYATQNYPVHQHPEDTMG